MLKAICVPCRRFYRIKKNGVPLVENMPKYSEAEKGPEYMSDWQPYKLWQGDLWECPNCRHEIIVGALNPVALQHETNFAETVQRFQPKIWINDC